MQALEEQIAVAIADGGESALTGADLDSMSNTPSNRSRNPSRFSVDGGIAETDIGGSSGPTCSRYLDNDPVEQFRSVFSD